VQSSIAQARGCRHVPRIHSTHTVDRSLDTLRIAASCFLFRSAPGNSPLSFAVVSMAHRETSRMWDLTIPVLRSLAYFAWNNIPQVHLCRQTPGQMWSRLAKCLCVLQLIFFFYFLNRDGTLEIRGLVWCNLGWLNAAGSDSLNSKGYCLSKTLLFLQSICYACDFPKLLKFPSSPPPLLLNCSLIWLSLFTPWA